MTSTLGFVLWGQVAGLTLGFAITRDWWFLQFLVWFIMVVRVTSDILAIGYVARWNCIFCGKPGRGTAWQAITTICNHNPNE